MKALAGWWSMLGVAGQQIANILFWDRITDRVIKARQDAEVEFFDKGFKHGEQAERDRFIAEGTCPKCTTQVTRF